MANWTPEGFGGQVFKLVGSYVPPPPGPPPPAQWGVEAVVRERLRNGFVDLQMEKQICPIKYPSPPSDVVEFFRVNFGPVKNAFEALGVEDQTELRCDLEQLWSDNNRAEDGTTYVEGEYLEVVATRV